ncbi:MAG: FecR domain-containing protein [Pseudomonadota bacterium]
MKTKIPPQYATENDAIAWLTTLNSSRLTQKQEQEFMHWLESSPLHQAAYIKIEQLWERGAVLSRLSEASEKKIWQFAYWNISTAGFAAVCSCFLFAAVGLFSFLTRTDDFTYQTAIGEVRDIQLLDGSRITINTNSQLKGEFGRKKRILYLTQGEVFFDVKKDGRSFEIVTQYGVVQVVGTRFSIYQSVTDAIVTVAEGRVALSKSLKLDNEFVPAIVLQANQRLSLQNARSGRAPEMVNANAAMAWRKNQLVFKGERLSEVMVELGRYFPETIRLGTPELGEREITAVIQLSDLKTTLQTLCQSLGLEAKFNPSDHSVTFFLPASKN